MGRRIQASTCSPRVAQGIRDAGFQRCTPIQAQTLPFALTGRDVAGQAQTGTGKTAAFLVSMFQTLLTHVPREVRPGAAIRGIVIAPTRELAVQIHNDALVLGKHTGLKLACVFGGVDYEKQRRQFEQRRRHPDRHAGPHHRLLQAACVRPAPCAGVRARRSRPHVRPRLHRRHPLHAAQDARAGRSPVDAVLGHAVAARAGARLRAHEQSGADPHRAGQDHGRQGAAAHLFPGHGREDAAADRHAARTTMPSAPWCS